MIGYKLFRIRKDGTLGTLFINRKQRIPLNTWLPSFCFPTKGYAIRPGWHVCSKKSAPHLSKKGRKWFMVEMDNIKGFLRPKCQGGLWYLAKQIKVLQEG